MLPFTVERGAQKDLKTEREKDKNKKHRYMITGRYPHHRITCSTMNTTSGYSRLCRSAVLKNFSRAFVALYCGDL